MTGLAGSCRAWAIALSLAVLPGIAFAQGAAGRPIRVVLPVAAAGALDPLARQLAQRLTEARGQPVIVENRPGGNGIIAAEFVAKSAPDGQTLFMTEASPLVMNPHLYKNMPYDGLKSFTPVTMLVRLPWVLGVNASVPATNLAELVALAKAKPDALSYGSFGQGSSVHILVDYLKKQLGVEILHVQYKGAGPAVTDLLAGQISMMMITPGLLEPHARTGKLRLIAAATPQRIAALPNLPTIAESGLPGYEAGTWFCIVGPAGMARDLVASLYADVAKIFNDPAFREQFLVKQWMEPVVSSPEQFAAQLRAEHERWGNLIRLSGVTVQ